jgi:TetR/AcrR family transcriptional repressor of nem operon
VTGPLFAKAAYHRHADPLDRIFGYINFRATIAKGPLEAFTCFAGTTLQEVFASSDAMRAACGEAIFGHAARLAEDFRAGHKRHPPRMPVTAESLATYTQTMIRGGFVLSKAHGDRAPLIEALAHLKAYPTLSFHKETLQ